MSAPLVAQKDFADAARSKLLWGISLVFVLLVGVIVWAANEFMDVSSATEVIPAFIIPSQIIVPIAALVVGYMAVVGERRTGSIKLLYGLPHRRSDILLGKLAGRTGVMAASIGVGFLVGAVLMLAFFGGVPVSEFVGLLAITVLFAMSFIGIAVGISAAVATRGKAMGLALGFYLVFVFFWEALASGVYYAVNGSIPGLKVESWYFLMKNLSPTRAYVQAANFVFDHEISGVSMFRIEDIPKGTSPEQYLISNRVIGEMPFYLEDWFGFVILGVWFVVPALVGYVRFRKANLG